MTIPARHVQNPEHQVPQWPETFEEIRSISSRDSRAFERLTVESFVQELVFFHALWMLRGLLKFPALLRCHMGIENRGLDVSGALRLQKQPVISGLRKAIRKGNLRGNGAVLHSRHGSHAIC